MCWGVRNMANFELLTVKSPSVEITFGEAKIQSNVIKDTDRNPNFDDPLVFQELVRPPICHTFAPTTSVEFLKLKKLTTGHLYRTFVRLLFVRTQL